MLAFLVSARTGPVPGMEVEVFDRTVFGRETSGRLSPDEIGALLESRLFLHGANQRRLYEAARQKGAAALAPRLAALLRDGVVWVGVRARSTGSPAWTLVLERTQGGAEALFRREAAALGLRLSKVEAPTFGIKTACKDEQPLWTLSFGLEPVLVRRSKPGEAPYRIIQPSLFLYAGFSPGYVVMSNDPSVAQDMLRRAAGPKDQGLLADSAAARALAMNPGVEACLYADLPRLLAAWDREADWEEGQRLNRIDMGFCLFTLGHLEMRHEPDKDMTTLRLLAGENALGAILAAPPGPLAVQRAVPQDAALSVAFTLPDPPRTVDLLTAHLRRTRVDPSSDFLLEALTQRSDLLGMEPKALARLMRPEFGFFLCALNDPDPVHGAAVFHLKGDRARRELVENFQSSAAAKRIAARGGVFVSTRLDNLTLLAHVPDPPPRGVKDDPRRAWKDGSPGLFLLLAGDLAVFSARFGPVGRAAKAFRSPRETLPPAQLRLGIAPSRFWRALFSDRLAGPACDMRPFVFQGSANADGVELRSSRPALPLLLSFLHALARHEQYRLACDLEELRFAFIRRTLLAFAQTHGRLPATLGELARAHGTLPPWWLFHALQNPGQATMAEALSRTTLRYRRPTFLRGGTRRFHECLLETGPYLPHHHGVIFLQRKKKTHNAYTDVYPWPRWVAPDEGK
jgi:hypothetical protein